MPFSHLYGKLTDLRNFLYDRGILGSYSLGARTISIGNVTTGGTGKTPLVAYVSRILAERGEKVCILTRGYGRKNPQDRIVVSNGTSFISDPLIAGDEPVELARILGPRAIIIADADRVAAAQWARREYGVTSFILDDAFQHRRARRDLDIVCIDATNPWGGGKTLPGGRLREPIKNLSRADVVIITRADLIGNIADLRSEIAKLNERTSVFAASTKVARVVELHEFKGREETVPSTYKDQANTSLAEVIRLRGDSGGGIQFLAFCGLGNPEAFFRQVRKDRGRPGEGSIFITQAFRDHHIYTQTDIDHLEVQAKEAGASALLTTVKDAVKLNGLKFTVPCFVVEVDLVLDEPDRFAALL